MLDPSKFKQALSQSLRCIDRCPAFSSNRHLRTLQNKSPPKPRLTLQNLFLQPKWILLLSHKEGLFYQWHQVYRQFYPRLNQLCCNNWLWKVALTAAGGCLCTSQNILGSLPSAGLNLAKWPLPNEAERLSLKCSVGTSRESNRKKHQSWPKKGSKAKSAGKIQDSFAKSKAG